MKYVSVILEQKYKLWRHSLLKYKKNNFGKVYLRILEFTLVLGLVSSQPSWLQTETKTKT